MSTRTIRFYTWHDKLATMLTMRDFMAKGYTFEKAMSVACAEEHTPRATVRRWLIAYGILPYKFRENRYINEPDWNELNRYLLPAYQRWTRSNTTRGASTLYQC